MSLSESFDLVEKLLTWKGSWASKSMLDDAVSRLINQQPQDELLANQIARSSFGYGAKVNFEKYESITGLSINTGSAQLNLPSDGHQVIDLSKVFHFYPTGTLSNLWIERLCEHLDVSRKGLNERIAVSVTTDDSSLGSSWSLLNTFSRPFIEQLLVLPRSETSIGYLEDERAKQCWRRWYYRDVSKTPILFDTRSKSGLMQSQWFVWRLIHDATHLVHLSHYPEAGDPLDPEWLVVMESVAMFVEKKTLEIIDENPDFIRSFGIQVDLHRAKTVLLLGFVERALRLDYDLAVHGGGESIESWLAHTKRKTGIHFNIYNFVEEFHGMPGFLAAYMVGLDGFEGHPNKHDILSGNTPLDPFHNKIDALSRSPVTDIPARKPEHEIDLDFVGTADAVGQIVIRNPFTDRYENANVGVNLYVGLKSSQRGIHMSRLQQVILMLRETNWSEIHEVAEFLARMSMDLQQSDSARSEVKLLLHKPTYNIRSQTDSSQPVELFASHLVSPTLRCRSVGLTLKIMTACPCTLAYSRLKTVQSLESLSSYDSDLIAEKLPPTFTHSQPGIAKVEILTSSTPVSLDRLYEQINSEAHVVESVLKRPDEHSLVEKVHRRPQFCEDLCRSIASSVASILNADDIVKVEVELDESIHPHKVIARLHAEASKLWN